MSKAADIKRASNALLEKIAKAQQALEAQKKALMEKNSAILAKAEEERRAQQKAEQEQARAEYEAQRAREEAEALAEAAKEEAAQAAPVQEEPVAKPKAEEKAPEAVPAAQTERPRKEAPKPEERGFKRPSSGYQNNGARPRREEGAPPAQGRQPFRANKDGAAGEQRKARPQLGVGGQPGVFHHLQIGQAVGVACTLDFLHLRSGHNAVLHNLCLPSNRGAPQLRSAPGVCRSFRASQSGRRKGCP